MPGRTEQALAADGAIACFSTSLSPLSLNADRAPQLKRSVRFWDLGNVKKPLPHDFQLTETDLVAIAHRRDVLESNNQRLKSRATVVSSVLIYGIIAALLWREVGACAFLAALPASFMAGLIVADKADFLMKPFVREPDESIKRYEAFREAEFNYEKWFRRTQEDFWNSLSGSEFECEVVDLLNRAGFSARLTSGAGDRGVDIVLDDGTIIQCKARRGPCGPAALRELYGSLHDFRAEKAILISREGFTSASIQFVEGKPISLWDRSTLIRLQNSLE